MSEQAKWQREKVIFASCLEVQPDFAGTPITDWYHNENPAPDIICTDARGRRIGVELTEWLHEEQNRRLCAMGRNFAFRASSGRLVR